MKPGEKRRFSEREKTHAGVVCRQFTSTGGGQTAKGVMRNFSKEGFYIETTSNYKSGTILQLRIVRYPSLSPALPVDATPRSITLAEIKWKQKCR
jgi:hypothetical protein